MAYRNERLWWGSFDLDEGAAMQWRIGPFRLAVRRLAQEWRLWYQQTEEDAEEWSVHAGAPADDFGTRERYVFRQTAGRLNIEPALADRPIVSQPYMPFCVPSGEEATIYVSSPLWVRVTVHEPAIQLQEIPIQRPSDTWFGPSTREGELCYASRTQGRLRLEDVPLRPHRALTPVRIRNEAQNAMLLERLNLPVPYLSVFGTSNGVVWTQPVVMRRERDGERASLSIEEGPRGFVREAKALGAPRQTPGKRVLERAFGALFG